MSETPAARPNLRNPVHLLAFGFGTGLSPYAPGTAGTVLAVFLYLSLAALPLPFYVAICAALFFAGIWICGKTSRDLEAPDHGGIVFDEIVGFLVAMTALPRSWPWLLSGFVLFRALDILKPWPIGWVERRFRGGFAIMADDLLAGLVTLGLLQLIHRLF